MRCKILIFRTRKIRMNSLPAEILLEIGRTDLETYKGMLAIPKFTRAVTIGYRLDMIATNCDYKFIRNRLPGLKALVNFSGKSIKTIVNSQQLDMNIHVTMINGYGTLSVWNSTILYGYYCNMSICDNSTYKNSGSRTFHRFQSGIHVSKYGVFYPMV